MNWERLVQAGPQRVRRGPKKSNKRANNKMSEVELQQLELQINQRAISEA